MSQIEKLMRRFLSQPKDFTWLELTKFLGDLGYKETQAGKTSGSRVRFTGANMKDMMKYKDYFGSVHYDSEALIFFGKVEFIKALLSYEATDAAGIKKAFEETVDDYLQMCHEEKIPPEKPFKGSFNIRTGHRLHQLLALAAQRENMSINKFVCHVLERACDTNHSSC